MVSILKVNKHKRTETTPQFNFRKRSRLQRPTNSGESSYIDKAKGVLQNHSIEAAPSSRQPSSRRQHRHPSILKKKKRNEALTRNRDLGEKLHATPRHRELGTQADYKTTNYRPRRISHSDQGSITTPAPLPIGDAVLQTYPP